METEPTTHAIIATPADKHYAAIRRAVKKYQEANRELCRERCRNWSNNLRNDPEKYRKYLDDKNAYMKQRRLSKKEEQAQAKAQSDDTSNPPACDNSAAHKGHNGAHESHFVSHASIV